MKPLPEVLAGVSKDPTYPAPGWQLLGDGRTAYVARYGDNYEVTAFPNGEVTRDNFELKASECQLMAWLRLSDAGQPTGSAPKPPAP